MPPLILRYNLNRRRPRSLKDFFISRFSKLNLNLLPAKSELRMVANTLSSSMKCSLTNLTLNSVLSSVYTIRMGERVPLVSITERGFSPSVFISCLNTYEGLRHWMPKFVMCWSFIFCLLRFLFVRIKHLKSPTWPFAVVASKLFIFFIFSSMSIIDPRFYLPLCSH